ncbi:MAG: leucine/isoleucine/valine transporter permease subunit [Ardenticatenaceae bacterium]|nr:leucine/isoleucine/valine transporter permease subunit [Ardenticatenaceae bacterium]MCB9004945.1 leucine/isoleucine/valine transporter permease subunit [Ardenticatenaceae bacterium]
MAQLDVRNTIRMGLLAGVVAVSLSMIGMVEAFDQRDVITDVFSLGQLLLFTAPAIVGYMVVQRGKVKAYGPALFGGLIAGVFAALPIFALLILTLIFPNIRAQLVNVSPTLIGILAFGNGQVVGGLLMTAVMGILGLLGAAIYVIPDRIGNPLILGLGWTLLVGVLSEVLLNILRPLLPRAVLRFLFGTKGITFATAVILLILITTGIVWWQEKGREQAKARREAMSSGQQKTRRQVSLGMGLILLFVLPLILGTYLTEVVDNVGLYILMGLGLNIVVGFAGLLDLGYVAFFAIGAYTVGVLTSQGGLGVGHLSFWVALPIAVATSTMAGMLLGVPVLRMRGDYLAIVTLGFGEIIRVLATSDLLKPVIGGAQGVLQIPKPEIFGFTVIQPQHFYYVILAGVFLAIFLSSRLRDARLGRQWMALREDEDVAEAMGIHLVKTKLLAFGIGAAFSGLAGAIFAARLSSIFPHSFNLLISINVLSLIIVGGMGSLPGVVVGALVLVGLPELLREFAEYRLLLYGALLIAMMVTKPEGLWPSPVRRRELRAAEEETAPQIEQVG